MSHIFCSDVSLSKGEPLDGTGKVAARILLLRWPRKDWRLPRYDSAGMGEALRAAILHAMDRGLHVALVDRQGETDAIPMLQAMPESLAADFDTEAGLIAAIRAYADHGSFQGRAEPRITLLCCTDSKRDACCARFGFATFKALKEKADPARFQLLQSTHIGGCRFAASLLALPNRQRYGRLSPLVVPEFLAELAAGRVYLPASRGLPDRPAAAQVAELALRRWALANGQPALGIDLAPCPAPDTPKAGEALLLNAKVGAQALEVRLVATDFHVNIHCEDANHGHGRIETRWRLDAVTRL